MLVFFIILFLIWEKGKNICIWGIWYRMIVLVRKMIYIMILVVMMIMNWIISKVVL